MRTRPYDSVELQGRVLYLVSEILMVSLIRKNGACPPTKNSQIRSVLELKKAKKRPKKTEHIRSIWQKPTEKRSKSVHL